MLKNLNKKFKIEHKIKTIDYYYDNIFYNKAIVDRIKEALKDDRVVVLEWCGYIGIA